MGLTSFHLGSWRWRIAVGALATVCCAMAFAQTRPLNDTGVTFSALATSGHSASCLTTDPAGQDCHFGRDAAFIAGAITKAGGSGAANGFDFTKISHSGNPLPASASLGAGLNDWACTRDNVTGLLWEVKTTSGLRDENHTYTWYRTNSPDGNIGGASGGTCYSAGRCDTEKFVQDVNTSELCGHATGWRMPTVMELQGVADFGSTPVAMDATYFPNTMGAFFWSGSLNAGGTASAWSFFSGTAGQSRSLKTNPFRVRLVNGAP